MIALPSDEKIPRLLDRLVAARLDFAARVDADGPRRARKSAEFARFAALEREAGLEIRRVVQPPAAASPPGPRPIPVNRALWVGGVLWTVIEADDDQGFQAGVYMIHESAIGRLEDLATA